MYLGTSKTKLVLRRKFAHHFWEQEALEELMLIKVNKLSQIFVSQKVLLRKDELLSNHQLQVCET